MCVNKQARLGSVNKGFSAEGKKGSIGLPWRIFGIQREREKAKSLKGDGSIEDGPGGEVRREVFKIGTEILVFLGLWTGGRV